jgi:hypothetical protein
VAQRRRTASQYKLADTQTSHDIRDNLTAS